jgi:hypothetical protein
VPLTSALSVQPQGSIAANIKHLQSLPMVKEQYGRTKRPANHPTTVGDYPHCGSGDVYKADGPQCREEGQNDLA